MSIEPVTYYRAVCDCCNDDVTAHGEFSAWSDSGVAADEVIEAGGLVTDSLVVCEDCHGRYRAGLEDEAWDELADLTPEALAGLRAWIDAKRTERANG